MLTELMAEHSNLSSAPNYEGFIINIGSEFGAFRLAQTFNLSVLTECQILALMPSSRTVLTSDMMYYTL